MGLVMNPAGFTYLSPVAPLETWREALPYMIIFSAAIIAQNGILMAGYPLTAAFNLHCSA